MAGEDPQIFITYRREDSAGYAGRLHDALRERIGRDRVFMDIVDIGPGVDFVEAIERAVASATVVIVVIGWQWLGVVDASGWRMPLGAGRCFCHAAGGVTLVRDVALAESLLVALYTALAAFPFGPDVWIRLVVWCVLPLALSVAAWPLRR